MVVSCFLRNSIRSLLLSLSEATIERELSKELGKNTTEEAEGAFRTNLPVGTGACWMAGAEEKKTTHDYQHEIIHGDNQRQKGQVKAKNDERRTDDGCLTGDVVHQVMSSSVHTQRR
jgi:hypothetical protein